jgi:uncharacterized delta-60 repeat protein
LDSSFGTGGQVVTNWLIPIGAMSRVARADAVVVQPNGKIVAAGTAQYVIDNRFFRQDFALARYNVDGTLDSTFGVGGQVLTDFGGVALEEGLGVALQPNGKIVVAGRSRGDFALARYDTDGSLDGSFGTGGKVFTDFGGTLETARDVAVQPDGKIVAAGPGALARYNVDGSLDSSFGTGGKVLTGGVNAVAVHPNGTIVAAGAAAGVGGPDFAVLRYGKDGSLDGSFGTGGIVLTDFGRDDRGHAVAIQPDGTIVVAGVTGGRPAGPEDDFVVARYLP